MALATTWRALLASRLLVWAAGAGAALILSPATQRKALNPPGMLSGFGWFGNLLAAPAARWDAAWYLTIAHDGYRKNMSTAFFPLYPLGLRAIAITGLPWVLAGVVLSVSALAFALYGIHRLTTLELGSISAARLAVLLMAFAPMAFYFSAVYSESLYLALSVGVFWYARQGRWAWAGALGGLAGATRSAGLVLVVPLLILYFYGPREDRPPDSPGSNLVRNNGRRRGHPWRDIWRALKPRYHLRRELLWLALLPVGAGMYMLYLGLSIGNALIPFHAQEAWSRQFVGPYLGVWDGARAAFDGARQLLSFQRQHLYFPGARASPFIAASHNLILFAFLLAAIPAIVGVLRRLPLAYGAYVLAALALPLSYPVTSQPLMSLPRFLVVLFPLSIWFAGWLGGHQRTRTTVLICSALLMAFFVGQFATWHWVA